MKKDKNIKKDTAQKENEAENKVMYLPIFMSIGISCGMAIGVAVGAMTVGMSIGLCVGLVVGIIMVTQVLLPVIQDWTSDNSTSPYVALITVVGTLAVISLVVFAARAISYGKD